MLGIQSVVHIVGLIHALLWTQAKGQALVTLKVLKFDKFPGDGREQ